ncbi:LacI family DNA-binding transcriptional regulator [Tepidibacillus fermentans]|uniref:LacI family transcriptional regulator n=1 Tax=Tepidibacillus fermentans TaxID=1281767 RepID=A0A4R3K931_9BACI|nr:substrate-binding domain-containing protein [Tepidibacillus fermentans]TCS79399.1 LacI family transcriptional regulator [Tepidibacillus fermentans]
MKRVTMADVAKMAKVSKSTVSQYLNKRYEYMAPETRKRIEEAIRVLGYQPNIVARSLKQKRTSTIGVIVANILHTFSTQIIRSIEDTCREHDIHVIVCNADDDPAKEANYIKMLRAKQVDGLIVFPTGGNIDLYQAMIQERYPIVFVDRIVEQVNVDSVLLNNERASYLAVEHFVKKGHQRIGMITTSLIRNITPRVERIKGFITALKAHNLPVNHEYIKGLEVAKIKDGLSEMFRLKEPPTALLVGNDLVLMEVLNYVKENSLIIPQDLAIIGIDEVPFANIFDPPLTTISQPTFEMGKKAAQLLLEKIEDQERSIEVKIHRFEPKLIIRSSC